MRRTPSRSPAAAMISSAFRACLRPSRGRAAWVAAMAACSCRAARSAGSLVTSSACSRYPRAPSCECRADARSAAARSATRAWAASASASGPAGVAR